MILTRATGLVLLAVPGSPSGVVPYPNKNHPLAVAMPYDPLKPYWPQLVIGVGIALLAGLRWLIFD